MTWRSTEDEMPPAGQVVLAVVQSPRPCVVLAQWCPKLTLPQHAEAEAGDYDEERDEFFAEEGWYQWYHVNGSLDDEPYWKIHETVSHWQETPAITPGAPDAR